jgi:hypothetical protein
MALENILILAATSLLWATILRDRGRTWFMLIASVLVIFWLQPALPIRGFDFWTPIATLVLVVLTWFITADDETRTQRKNIIILLVVASIVLLLNLTRFNANLQIFTPTPTRNDSLNLFVYRTDAIRLISSDTFQRFIPNARLGSNHRAFSTDQDSRPIALA